MRLIVLAYHHITADESSVNSRLYMDAERFDQQLSYITQTGLPVIATASEIEQNQHTNQTAIMLTFDDAYENFYTLAYPLLQKYNLPSVLFVPTAKIGLRMYEADYGYLQSYVNRKQIKEMAQSGLVNIQPHGHSHVHMGDQKTEVQREEIELSVQYLTQEFGITPTYFCLPYGSSNTDTYDILKDMGIEYVFTTNDGENILPLSESPASLNRFAFKSSVSLEDFRRALALPEKL